MCFASAEFLKSIGMARVRCVRVGLFHETRARKDRESSRDRRDLVIARVVSARDASRSSEGEKELSEYIHHKTVDIHYRIHTLNSLYSIIVVVCTL